MTTTHPTNRSIALVHDDESAARSIFGARFWAFFEKNPDFASAVGASHGVSRGCVAPGRANQR